MAINTIKFSEFISDGDLDNGSTTVGLGLGTNVQFNNPWTFLPPGTTAERPVPSGEIDYRLRLNTDTGLYEYYDVISAGWETVSAGGSGTVNNALINQIAYYTANGDAVSGLATQNNSVLATNGIGLPAMTTALPSAVQVSVGSLNSGSSASSSTFWRGDGTWSSPGTVGVPAGTIISFGGVAAPAAFLVCDGSAVSRTTYSLLFAAIGIVWGSGDGSTTFNLPSLSRNTLVGSGGTGTAVLSNIVGDTGGSETHLQTTAELAAHTHTYGGILAEGFTAGNAILSTSGSAYVSGSTGSSTPFNIIQPSAIVLYCIKT